MIQKNYFPTPTTEPYTFIHLYETPAGDYKLSTGTATDFTPTNTLVIPRNNPALLLKLIHELTGLTPAIVPEPVKTPEPVIEPPVVEPVIEGAPIETPIVASHDLEKELNSMPASEIIAKVLADLMVKITLSPKSKKAIVKRALALYKG